MDCPYCGKPMDQGYLCAGGYAILWTKKPRKFSSLAGDFDISLQELSFTGKNDAMAYACRTCRKIVLDYQ